MLIFYFFSLFFILLLGQLLLKVQINLVPADILKSHGVHPVPLGNRSELPVFFLHISVQITFSSNINMQIKGFIKILPWSGLLLPFYEFMNIEMALKSRSYNEVSGYQFNCCLPSMRSVFSGVIDSNPT